LKRNKRGIVGEEDKKIKDKKIRFSKNPFLNWMVQLVRIQEVQGRGVRMR
jgi:hypothetical protein